MTETSPVYTAVTERPLEDLLAELRVAVERRDKAKYEFDLAVKISNDQRAHLLLEGKEVERIHQRIMRELARIEGRDPEQEGEE